jgi:hypothetical protein
VVRGFLQSSGIDRLPVVTLGGLEIACSAIGECQVVQAPPDSVSGIAGEEPLPDGEGFLVPQHRVRKLSQPGECIRQVVQRVGEGKRPGPSAAALDVQCLLIESPGLLEPAQLLIQRRDIIETDGVVHLIQIGGSSLDLELSAVLLGHEFGNGQGCFDAPLLVEPAHLKVELDDRLAEVAVGRFGLGSDGGVAVHPGQSSLRTLNHHGQTRIEMGKGCLGLAARQQPSPGIVTGLKLPGLIATRQSEDRGEVRVAQAESQKLAVPGISGRLEQGLG